MESKYFCTRISQFTDEERKEIKDLIRLERKLRRYKSRPELYHDLVMRGCRSKFKEYGKER